MSNSGNNTMLLKLDSSGAIQWNKQYMCTEVYNVLIQGKDENQGYLVGGGGNGKGNNFLFKVDSSGNFLWGKSYGSDYTNGLFSFKSTNDNGIIMCGLDYASNGIYVVKADFSGNAPCYTLPTVFNYTSPQLNIQQKFIQDTVIINAYVPVVSPKIPLITQNISCVSVSGINEEEISDFLVSPNPSYDGNFIITFSGDQKREISIYNLLGEKIYYALNSSSNYHIHLSNQLNGIYFLKVQSDSGNSTLKIIKAR